MAGKVDRFVTDAFLQTAIAGDDIGVMADEVVAVPSRQHSLRQRHPDRCCKALSERPGRRLDPQRMPVFGMAGGAAAELTETLQFLDRHVRVAKQMMQGVLQHRTVAGGQNEAIAVGPVWPSWIDVDEAVE